MKNGKSGVDKLIKKLEKTEYLVQVVRERHTVDVLDVFVVAENEEAAKIKAQKRIENAKAEHKLKKMEWNNDMKTERFDYRIE